MTQRNPLGLLGQYGYSDSDSEDEKTPPLPPGPAAPVYQDPPLPPLPPIGPVAPVPMAMQQCPWSPCYDETTGYTYYWNQYTNAVSWEPPPEYLYAMSQAQQHVENSGSAEVSVEEWQLYQQALAEKQLVQHNHMKTATEADLTKSDIKTMKKDSDISLDKNKKSLKRPNSESEDDKIELITSYQHSDTDSNDEADSPVKKVTAAPKNDTVNQTKATKHPAKKQKTKTIEYGPDLPPNQNYTVPIGPELPPDMSEVVEGDATKLDDAKTKVDQDKNHVESKDTNGEVKVPTVIETNKAITEAQKSSQSSAAASPVREIDEQKKDVNTLDLDVDDLLEEIEKKELKKIKVKAEDTLADDTKSANEKEKSVNNSPEVDRYTPPKEVTPLFPSSNNIDTEKCDSPKSLFPSSANIVKNGDTVTQKVDETNNVIEKKEANMYIVDKGDIPEKATRKKLRISQSVLPEKKKGEVPSYTTKYAQCIEGNANERTGLGFNKLNEDLNDREPSKNTIMYGKGLLFTKGETLHDEKRIADEAEKVKRARADDDSDLLSAKLKFLNEQQTYSVAPVQEMTIQMQTLTGAYIAGALKVSYWQRWLNAAKDSLLRLEEAAAPPGWLCEFARAECRYRYVRESDGYIQWEYPSVDDDMDICNTPPPPDDNVVQEEPPLLPALSPATPPRPPPPPPPPTAPRTLTPTPPPWHDPPPPGCEDTTPPLVMQEAPKRESIGEELRSFYDDLAELEKKSEPALPATDDERSTTPPLKQEHKRDKEETKAHKKKSNKVKISSSVGLKHKTVSNLVAKWRQVADEIHSD